VALREAGTSSFFQADYSSSQLYLDQYVHSNVNYGLDDKAHQGFFYYAELLRREKKLAEANRYYESAIQRIDANKLNSTESLAIRAQSQVWMGDVEGGLKAFDEARARHPQDDLLRADQISTLLELKRYDEARALLALPRHSHLNSVSSETVIPTAGGTVRDYQLISPNELLIRYHKPEQTNQAAQALKDTPWVNYTSEGYDTLLVASRPGTMIEINKSGSEPSFKAVVDNASPSYQDERQIALRYELLAARADLETGNVYHATSRLNDLAPEYPNDAQLKGFLANAENYGGNWPRALTLLKEARTITPENEDLARLDRDIRRLNSPNVKIDHEWVKRGRNQEQITTLSGYVDAADNIQVGANLQNDHVRAKNIRRADGRIGNFSENRQRGELYAQVHGDNGMRAKLSLYGNNDTAGVGGTFSFLNMLGETTLAADLHRPYWDYVEGVLDDATRDRLSLVHTIKPTQRLVLSAGGNVNVYNVDVKDNVISTAGFEFDAVYRLLDEQPYLAVAYSVDGEYETSSKRGTDSQGGFTRLFPLRSRELHFISVNAGYEFDDVTYGDILLGYGYDRLTGNSGPSIEGRLTHELTEHLDAQIRASYGIDNGSSNNDVNISRVGGYVRWRF
jgi:tetratricopeptide (TPR) repeat protein